MQSNSSETESLSIQCDEMDLPEIVQFVLVTALRLFSIFSCYVIIHFIFKHKPIRNKANSLVVNLCIVVSIHFLYATAYQFFRWKSTILPEDVFEIVRFIYFIIYLSLVTTVFMLPLFWFLFLTLKNLFLKFDILILFGLFPPYIIPSIFVAFIWHIKHWNFQKFYYYFILYYCVSLLLTFCIVIYFIMLKLEERLKRNKLDYLLYLGVSFLISMLPEVFCFTLELYFFDERGPLYFRVYYISLSVDFIKSICPLILFTWLVASNKYFRKAFKKTFTKENIKNIFRVKKKNIDSCYVEDDEILDMKLNLNEVFL